MSVNTAAPSAYGRLFMVGLPGPRLDPVARSLVRELRVGGVVLFARNLESPQQIWELTRALQQEALAAAGLPLLIAVDQEGGPVERLKAPFASLPSARELGRRASPQEVEDLARQTAWELALVGFNVNLAPVLDVARGPECPLYERSYGADPELVAALGQAALRGYLAGGVLPVVKHFPGLGDTLRDSHVELPTAQGKDPSRQVDLLPFRRAVAAGAPLVMTAHILVPEWDARPATLSPVAIRTWLRRELGFAGVVMTDDLEMGAIAGQVPVPRAAREALAAGADLLLICERSESAWEAAALLQEDETLWARVQEAGRRLEGLRRQLTPSAATLAEVKEYFAQARHTAKPGN
ncbi:MAG: beta-N-acetylhexosaminidase [Deltaproteobacteria bacterium]|nr:beta-N-acetylhexosaminidase [Deltaproteobacteria bacterium]